MTGIAVLLIIRMRVVGLLQKGIVEVHSFIPVMRCIPIANRRS